MFYQGQPFIGYPHVQGMYPLDESLKAVMNEQIALFLISVMQRAFGTGYSYGNKFTRKIVMDTEIVLPVTQKGVPDWEYMQERIVELEQECIAELEQYLKATGLNDYTLTDEDIKTLALPYPVRDKTGNSVSAVRIRKKMKEFKISDVFNLFKGKRLTQGDQFPGDTPFVGSTENNNGVTGYIGQKPIFDGNAITISYNGSVGQVFYQEHPFWASDDINVLYLKNHMLDRELFEYLGTALYKVGRQFSYSFKWHLESMKETMFTLPIQTDDDGRPVIDPAKTYHPDGFIPDWDYMAEYIRAVEKLVIKDVVSFKDEFVKTAKAAAGYSGV